MRITIKFNDTNGKCFIDNNQAIKELIYEKTYRGYDDQTLVKRFNFNLCLECYHLSLDIPKNIFGDVLWVNNAKDKLINFINEKKIQIIEKNNFVQYIWILLLNYYDQRI